ncbi:MAG: hypothetical protein DSY66_03090 [Persephonella sp.]|nr:MAG: hypothetical protein DSY66_03090 [Persephonella sp.]
MDKKEKEIKLIEESIKKIKELPNDRKLFFNTGVIMIEVSKEEAIKLLEEKLKELK